ncbi:MAG: molybdate ABC transporter substrate-binding protein [Thermodesulfovibrionales bacterium]
MKWSDRTILFLFSCLLVFLSGTQRAAGSEITVSAALSLKAPFEEMGRSFEAKTGTKVSFNFGASGILQRQIEGGAPSDIFASASPKEMDSLESGGFLVKGTRSNFAGNGIVLIVPSQSLLKIRSFEDLRKKEIRRIAIGNPATAPAGKYAEEVLKSSGLWETIKDRIVLCENVRQVMDYTARNEVDAGIVFRTDVSNSKDVEIISEASGQSHKPVLYVVAAIKGTGHDRLAKEFIALLMSDEGRKIMKRYGFRNIK